MAKNHIPNRLITIRPFEPPWITTHINTLIRCRRRLFRKAKQTTLERDRGKFRTMRNKIVAEITRAKLNHQEKLAGKLQSTPISRSW